MFRSLPRSTLLQAAAGIALLGWSVRPGGTPRVAAHRAIDLSRENTFLFSFSLAREGRYNLQLAVAGAMPECALAADPPPPTCRNAPPPLRLAWRLTTAGGESVTTGNTDAGVRGAWGDADGSGVTLATFADSTRGSYRLAVDVRAAVPRLMNLQPQVRVAADPAGREADRLWNALAGVLGLGLLVSAALTMRRRPPHPPRPLHAPPADGDADVARRSFPAPS
ncbi:MAG TPA: hypothetical protein VG916_06520 [Gemmatimonadaceae bacterium]|nr:hypothetical protein [Gemmatimonadaceae bacterium]